MLILSFKSSFNYSHMQESKSELFDHDVNELTKM